MKNRSTAPSFRIPHNVIVRSPGLLPMLYKVSEIAEELDIPDRTLRDWLSKGAPHQRDSRGHIWINGKRFSSWVTSIRKKKRTLKLRDDEAFCFRCNEAVKLISPEIRHIKGNLILIKGVCINCGCTINRGGRDDQ